ncbi:hypothetical protein C8R48DRAFT_729627 [Suillus tomentosus]|nr:hypothetical protein C8R48DRAFT_729627 [Suillus tomentosus]
MSSILALTKSTNFHAARLRPLWHGNLITMWKRSLSSHVETDSVVGFPETPLPRE